MRNFFVFLQHETKPYGKINETIINTKTMMKKALQFLAMAVALLAVYGNAFAYDGSVVAPSGQTLYYNYVNSTGSITIVRPSSFWTGYTEPAGALVIPDSVMHNGTMYPVTAIGNSTFDGCDGLTSVTIPQGLLSIGMWAFAIDDSPLTNLVIPDGVTEIGNYAFSGIRHIEYHGSATYGSNTYWGACSMNGVIIGDFVFSDSTMVNLTGYIGSDTNVTIPATVDTIGGRAFYKYSVLSTVTFPDDLVSIGESAFYMCELLVNLTLPDSLTDIGTKAFYGCLNLVDVRIPDRVDTIGRNAFYLFRHIEYHGSATYEENYPYWGAYSLNGVRDGHFIFADSTHTTLTCYLGNGPHVTIPTTVDTIEQGAFATCDGLTSITLPEGLRYIGVAAFSYCVNLQSIDIPDGIATIRGEAFSYCLALTTVHIGSGISKIYNKTFEFCLVLNSVNIPEGVTSIGTFAFVDCRALPAVTLPASVTSIDNYAFYDCLSLTDLYALGDTAPQLGNYVFSYANEGMLVHIPCGSLGSYSSVWGNQINNFSEELMYTLNVLSADETMGSVEVLTEPDCEQDAVVQAIPGTGYVFDHWSDGDTNHLRTLSLTSDTTLIAYFATDGVGINEFGSQLPLISVRNGRIVIEGAEGETLQVFDIQGRQLMNGEIQTSHFEMQSSKLSTGTYIVKVGRHAARKIVVINQ